MALQNENNPLTAVFAFRPPSNLTDTLLKFQGTAPEREENVWKQKGGRSDLNKADPYIRSSISYFKNIFMIFNSLESR